MNLYMNKSIISKAIKTPTRGRINLKAVPSTFKPTKTRRCLKKKLQSKKPKPSKNASIKDPKKLSTSTLDSLNSSKSKLAEKIKKKKRAILKKQNKLIGGKYIVKRPLGKGSNNRVYLVEQVFKKKLYAMKVFKLEDLRDPKKLHYLQVSLDFGFLFCKTFVDCFSF